MSRKLITIGFVSIAFIVTLFVAHAHPDGKNTAKDLTSSAPALLQISTDLSLVGSKSLSFQPEAVKLIRQLGGRRFSDEGSNSLFVTGVLTTRTEQRTVQIARRQNARGERVEVAFVGDTKVLAWDDSLGAVSSRGAIDVQERALLERLTFDSVDQFILAQLRGASYYVVARNVRPDQAPDDYHGPIWHVVRIDDPEADAQKRPLSPWRLYYINSNTGLIDKVASELQGERIEANFSNWTERVSERFPFTITWTSGGKTFMTFTVTNVSSVAQ